ncbi:hypothetical protein [Stigmatella aurantiaca]|uniref:Uncharacterized protein n=1 Tax=Stigmatella aurantiaca (strain DW4/3-1) TaxID=378806 RepID=Q08WA7_STIAD|nr:hypothetical protein [Stigmatella aurantiaca]EAU64761.1 hypothetical protein STIAU_0415 [Stigmatella aurantiaca DW4/3-1]
MLSTAERGPGELSGPSTYEPTAKTSVPVSHEAPTVAQMGARRVEP